MVGSKKEAQILSYSVSCLSYIFKIFFSALYKEIVETGEKNNMIHDRVNI